MNLLSVVTKGQPSIGECFTLWSTMIEIYWMKGKSYWILCALCQCLAEGRSVIWYHTSTWFLFVNEGIYVALKDSKFRSTDLNSHVWTLVTLMRPQVESHPNLLHNT